ncbi:peptidase M15 [Mycobacterium hodleri]|uniref:Peptidase M15 n=2 Tax=Mycolicibacterium hodleri TaxID=49897 RepID=A0A502E883_9MYCO|nr:peptidase M15 [Mycolicibacterium hodleri]
MGCTPATPAPTPTTGPVIAVEPLAIGLAATLAPGGQGPVGDSALSIGSGAVDTTGGFIPDGQMASPFDVKNPVVGFLDPMLLRAIQGASRAAATEGVDVMLTSGWRSNGFQRRLFDEAVTTYGSVDIASQFVASPDESMHVIGKAVDVGPVVADEWMIRNGPRFGLCQIYANEIWHFELVADAQGNCPPLRPDAAG